MNFDIDLIITIVGFIIVGTGLYWKIIMRQSLAEQKYENEVKSLRQEIMNNKTHYDENYRHVLSAISELKQDIKELKEYFLKNK